MYAMAYLNLSLCCLMKTVYFYEKNIFPFYFSPQDLGEVQEELQQELQEDEFDDGLYSDVDSNDSDNDEIEDNTSIASAKRPGLRSAF